MTHLQNHRERFPGAPALANPARVAAGGDLDHDARPVLSKVRRDEDEEDVVDEQEAEEERDDLEGAEPYDAEEVDGEGDAKQVLEDPGPRLVPEDDPDDGDGRGDGEEDDLADLEGDDLAGVRVLEPRDVEARHAGRQTKCQN